MQARLDVIKPGAVFFPQRTYTLDDVRVGASRGVVLR